ncbi:MAG: fatty acyl-AMP ligase [Desulfopila sp.]
MQGTPTSHNLPLRAGDFTTLVEALDYAANGETGYNFYSGRGEIYQPLPYAVLRDEAYSLARKLMTLDLPRGARVALIADTHPDFVRLFFACQYAGLTPVPLPAVIQLNGKDAYIEQITRLLVDCQARIALATEDFMPYLAEAAQGLDIRFVGRLVDLQELPDSKVQLQPKKANELAYLQYTSGSTRFPRGVMITQAAVCHNLKIIIQHGVQVRTGDRAVSWLPFFHDMGLVGLVLVPMACQVSVDYLRTRDFAMRPRLWLKLLSENKGTISFSPPFGYDLVARRLRDSDPGVYDLASWRVAGVGAEIIRPQTLDRFARQLAPAGFDERAFLACYGMAECSLAVTFSPLGQGMQVDRVDTDELMENGRAVPVADGEETDRTTTFVKCGVLMPGYEAEIRDEQGQPLAERLCGNLYLRGSSLMSGYFGNLKLTREVLSDDGWFDTGDIAYRVGNKIVITGRAKDMIIINGRNIWPQDIEYLAECQEEIRTGDAMAFFVHSSQDEELAVMMVECRLSEQQQRLDLITRLRRLIRQELGVDCVIELVPRGTLTRTTSGKPSRHATKKIYLEKIASTTSASELS